MDKKDFLESKEVSMEEVLLSNSKNDFKEHTIIFGEIVKIDSENVLVDVGLKSEGIIPRVEFVKVGKDMEIKVGERIEVYLKKREGKSGCPLLSYEKAQEIKILNSLKKSHQTGEAVEGRVLRKIKGGLCIDIGKEAFLPRSQIGLQLPEDLNWFIGQKLRVKITEFSPKENNIVVSSRLILEKERELKRRKIFASLKEGKIYSGVVRNITEFGAFIDIGGIDGLLHKSDISWGRVKKVEDYISIGEEIETKVLSFNQKTGKISLGLKQLTPHPWENIEEKYPIGSKVSGRVSSIADFGFFVKIEEGVEGLVHISEISWTEKITHPSKIVSKGMLVKSRVLNIDKANKKISLGIKQITPNPWKKIKEKYLVGMKICGKVTNLCPFGAFIRLEEGIEGMIHIKDMSWIKGIKHPKEILKKSDQVEAMILDLNPEEEKITLGLKQASKNPYLNYKKGNNIKGQITRLTDFGVFVKIEEGIEGMIHISQISEQYINKPRDMLKIGDEIFAKIIDVNYEEGRIDLSVKELEKEEMNKYMQSSSLKVSLGDIVGDKLNKLKKGF